MNHNFIFCGVQGSGKTTFGRRVAFEFDRPFIDTDDLIKKKYSSTCSELYAHLGDVRFREIEWFCIQKVIPYEGSVIALGGGCLLKKETFSYVKKLGKIIYLEITEEEYIRRTLRRLIAPSFINKERMKLSLRENFVKRARCCKAVANITISVDEKNAYQKVINWIYEQK